MSIHGICIHTYTSPLPERLLRACAVMSDTPTHVSINTHIYIYKYILQLTHVGTNGTCICTYISLLPERLLHAFAAMRDMGWIRLVGSLKSQVSFAKEPYKRDDILQKRPIILRSLLIVATLYPLMWA